jgi:hypothetical protein
MEKLPLICMNFTYFRNKRRSIKTFDKVAKVKQFVGRGLRKRCWAVESVATNPLPVCLPSSYFDGTNCKCRITPIGVRDHVDRAESD